MNQLVPLFAWLRAARMEATTQCPIDFILAGNAVNLKSVGMHKPNLVCKEVLRKILGESPVSIARYRAVALKLARRYSACSNPENVLPALRSVDDVGLAIPQEGNEYRFVYSDEMGTYNRIHFTCNALRARRDNPFENPLDPFNDARILIAMTKGVMQ